MWSAMLSATLKSRMGTVDCVDRFGRRPRYLRISVTARCNFRCLYCAPENDEPGRISPNALSDDEIVRLVAILAPLGVRKVRFTGGEPLLRPGLAMLMARIGHMPGIRTIALSTNAYLLEENLDALIAAGLDTVNISCDTLREERFVRITRRHGLDRVRAAIDACLEHPRIRRVKINTVVMRGINDDEIDDLAGLCFHPKVDVRFIEFMPTAEVAYSRDMLVPERELRDHFGPRLRPIDNGDSAAPAKLWTLPDRPGRIGFISTMTHKFCADCTRIRITADGRVANCLFSETLLDLRAMLRGGADNDEIRDSLAGYWRTKAPAHRLEDPSFLGRPTMIAVGG